MKFTQARQQARFNIYENSAFSPFCFKLKLSLSIDIKTSVLSSRLKCVLVVILFVFEYD